MKTFLLILSLITLNAAHGQHKIVNSLNVDSCWLESHSVKEGPVKWVNFSTHSVGLIESELITEVAELVDQDYGFLLKAQQQSAQALFHCSSKQSSLVVNINYGTSRVCAWVRLDHQQPRLERVGVEPLLHHGHCNGAVFKQAILNLSDSAQREKAIHLIQERLKKYDVEIEDQQMLTDRVWLLSFSSNIIMAQEKILNELALELKDKGLARSLELNYYQGETGEFHPLD